jgi:hypothetical protein
MLCAKHDLFQPFWHMLVRGRQLDALWELSEPSPGMTDLLGYAVGQTLMIIAHLAHVGVWRAAGGTMGAFQAQSGHKLPATHTARVKHD